MFNFMYSYIIGVYRLAGIPSSTIYIGYLAPLTNLAAQTEFSQWEKDCISP